MTFFIDEKEYSISKESLENSYISEGMEGTVYIFKGEALKIYHEHEQKKRLTEDECKYLKQINTKRIILPKSIVYDENKKFIGYTMPYHQGYSLENLKRIKLSLLKQYLNEIKKDVILLSDKGVDLDDFHLDNIILDDGLYIIDPGSYKVRENDRYLKSDNLYRINNFLFENIIAKSSDLPKKYHGELKQKILYDDFISDYLPESNKSVMCYLKKLIKNNI